MIKRDTDIQPVAPLEFPNPAQFPMLIPTRVFPFYCSVPMDIMGVAWHVPSCVNGQWASALEAIEGDEPSLTTAVAVQMKVSLINNTESGVIFLLVENAILQNNYWKPTLWLDWKEKTLLWLNSTRNNVLKKDNFANKKHEFKDWEKNNLKWYPCEFNRCWFHYTIQRPW